MGEQFSLLGDEASTEPTDGYFIALFPPPDVAEEIATVAASLRRSLGLGGQPLLTHRFHVAVIDLGEHIGPRPEIFSAAMRAAERVAVQPFDVEFDVAASFKRGASGGNPFVLQASQHQAGLAGLRNALKDSIARELRARDFKAIGTPHVTLLYDRELIDPHAVAPIGWRAQEFVLVRSLIGQTVHEPLARFPLVD